jgi:hypothetical protein
MFSGRRAFFTCPWLLARSLHEHQATNMKAKILRIDDDMDVLAALASEPVEGCLLRSNRMSRFY